jgi:hypothetical protein
VGVSAVVSNGRPGAAALDDALLASLRGWQAEEQALPATRGAGYAPGLNDKERHMPRPLSLAVVLTVALAATLGACAQRQIHVLTGPPVVAYRTQGMLSGQGENESSAITMIIDQAARLDADAVIVESRRPVGRVIIVTARAIKYLAPPPEAPQAPGPGAPPGEPPPAAPPPY